MLCYFVIGTVAKVGSNITGFAEGDRCVANPGVTCEKCFYCRRGQSLLCKNFNGQGVTMAGGFAEYVIFEAKKAYKIEHLTDEEATLVEPAACIIHGMDKLNPPVGIDALVIGAGPTGLILAQLLKLNGAAKVVLAANKGIKTRIAQDLGAADVYVELDRETPAPQWEQLRRDHLYGFDVVIEATGNEEVANDSINYVQWGGTLMIYGVYSDSARVHWPPSKIFGDEINMCGNYFLFISCL
ncbi:chaperonin 10-like protein [Suillus ampliporus]|nr:chaperonin 10-like protein [Suillus ampliporus]